VLSDDEKKKRYDQYGHQAFDESQFYSNQQMDPEELLRHFGFGFADMFGGGGRGMRSRGADIEIPLSLNFMEAVNGGEKEVKYSADVTCGTCSGSGAKPGSKVNTCKTCGGRGVVSASNGLFSFTSACNACGGEGTTVSTPCSSCRGKGVKNETKVVSVKIPPGVESGNTLRLVGQGAAGHKNSPAGNLYITLNVRNYIIYILTSTR
jgi:molecular chaperone DnaJ